MLPPEITDKPPAKWAIAYRVGEFLGDGTYFDTALDAFNHAKAIAETNVESADWTYTTALSADAVARLEKNSDDFDPPKWRATYFSVIEIKWLYYSATCYFKIWWDVETDKSWDVAETNSFNEVMSPSSVSGLCLPSGWKDGDIETWDEGEVHRNEPDPTGIPDESFTIDLLFGAPKKYSQLAAYTPPDDGSANGFPA